MTPPIKDWRVMSASKIVWIDQLKALSEKRRAVFEIFEPRLPWAPSDSWAREAFERRLNRISVEESALLGMYDDLEVLVRKRRGAPRTAYHLADPACGHAYRRDFRRVLESQARAMHLTRCVHCRWPATEDLRVSA